MKAFFDWALTVGSALSQLAYAVFANSRNSNLSISGEAYFNRKRSRLRYVWYKFINMLFFMQKDHCKWAYENDLKFAQWYIDRDRNSRL